MKTRKSGSNAASQEKYPSVTPGDSDLDWNLRIATAAYYKAESRGFAPGSELDDWISAEAELNDWTKSQMEAESC